MGSRERSFTGNTPDAVEYGSELSTYGFRFDACNNLTKLRCSVLGNTWETTYTYDNDNRPSTATLDSGKVITNTYDKLGRLQKKTIGLNTPYETTITYVDVGTNKTSGLIASYRNGNDDPYLYTYDDNGNITSVTHGSIVNTYVYDTANRLIRENNAELNQTITYAYDDWGNNTNESHYAYTTSDNLGTPIVSGNHQYTNSEWGDQQTGFNGEVITYDAMGNPLSYRNGFYNFTWRGRLLTGFTSGNYTYTFEYDEKGLRQKKTVVSPSGTNTTEYYYEGDVLIGMKRNSAKFLFSYDASGSVVSVNYNGTEYYYLRNAQGDIVKLIDGTGATVVEYTYRTRGRQISVTGSMASVLGSYQPFRWRGYVLDPEWGIYYLNSRYYDPNSSRFLSPDTYLSTGQGVMGYNAYAYCLDNPVNMVDTTGFTPVSLNIHVLTPPVKTGDFGRLLRRTIKIAEFIEYLHGEVNNRSIYVWGACGKEGNTITEKWITKQENKYNDGEYLEAALTAFRKRKEQGGSFRAFDCSGLGSYWLIQNGSYTRKKNARQMYEDTIPIDMSNIQIGDWVFRLNNSGKPGHIGYIVDGLYVIHAAGREPGVIHIITALRTPPRVAQSPATT